MCKVLDQCRATQRYITFIGGEEAAKSGFTLGQAGLAKKGITVLAIERKDTAISFPSDEELLTSSDYILCYGKITQMI